MCHVSFNLLLFDYSDIVDINESYVSFEQSDKTFVYFDKIMNNQLFLKIICCPRQQCMECLNKGTANSVFVTAHSFMQ